MARSPALNRAAPKCAISNRPRDHKLASAIADCGFYEFKRQLTYKCEWYGSELIIADRFYPSSQICSHCGHQQKMPLSVRTYKCSNCGFEADRDFNAAVNKRKLCESVGGVPANLKPVEKTSYRLRSVVFCETGS